MNKDSNEQLNSLFEKVAHRDFNKSLMNKRKQSLNDSGKYVDEEIELDIDIYKKIEILAIENDVTFEDYLNDIVGDLLMQVVHSNEKYEVIDNHYLEQNLNTLLKSDKDYLIVNQIDDKKSLLLNSKDIDELK